MPINSDIPHITILTPTWNRRHLLPRLYQSLVEQEAPYGTFDWLVIDDGSTDGTSEWLETLVPDAPFSILLIRQENGGKHRALNRAAQELVAQWVLIVDSDDWLLPDAIRQTIKDTAALSSNVKAVIAPRALAGRDPQWFKIPNALVDFAAWHAQRHVGDTSIIMRSHLLRQNPFPEYEGEKFIAEDAAWAQIFCNGGILLSASRIIGGEYQPDGLSARGMQLWLRNPLGTMATNRAVIEANIGRYRRYRLRLNYHRLYWHAISTGKHPRTHGLHINFIWILPGFLRYLIDRALGRHSQ